MSAKRPVARRAGARPALGVELLEDRTVPANLRLDAAFPVDGTNVPQANPVFGQMVFVRAEWTSQAMTGAEPAVPVRYTVNGIPANSGNVNHGAGGGNWVWWRGGWYAGTTAFTVTVTVDPNNQIAETNEADNTLSFSVTPVAPTTLPSKFLTPIGRTPNRDWAINNYADVDPRSGVAADYRGGPYNYDGHDAIDAGPWGFDSQDAGLPIYAAADGVVTQVLDGQFDRQTAMSGAQGNYVRVSHGNSWETLYYHFATNSITVEVGDGVKAGQVIGLMGSSGNSTGAHLHYTAIYRGADVEAGFAPDSYWISPLPYGGDVAPFALAAGVANADPGPDGQEKVPQIGAFPTTGSGTLSFWVQTYNLHTTDVLRWEWYRPNGTLFSSFNLSPTQDYRFSWWWRNFSLTSFQSAPGTWQVVNRINGAEVRRVDFTVNMTGEPSVRLATATNQIVIDGRTTPIDFGAVPQSGAPAQVLFNVRNHGYGTLALSNFAPPTGFSLVSAPATLAAGATGTIIVRLDTAFVGSKFGTLRFDTNDPDVGTFEFNLAGVVTGTPVPGAQVIDLDGSPTVTVNPATAFNYLSLPRPLSPAATLTAGAANFAGGTLRVEFASFGAADDRLAVRNVGTGAGQIGVSGSSVTYAGTTIGTLTGGSGTTPLVVTLNANATVPATQALLRALTYQNVGVAPTYQRKAVRYTLTAASGLESNLAVQHVVNTGVARSPTVAALPAQTVVRGTGLSYTGSFSDPHAFAWTATVDYGDGSGVQPLPLNPDKTFNLSRLYTAAPGPYSVTVTITSDVGGVTTAVMPVTVVAPVGVAGVTVNDGAAQRSLVTSIRITFSGLVTLPATPASAFSLTGPNGAVALTVDTSASTATQTVVTLTFSGEGTEFGSLADGRYTLRVTAALVRDQYGAALDGDADGLAGGDNLSDIHRLFGDGDGDGAVTLTDADEFFNTFNLSAGPGFLPWYDFDGDGAVTLTDADEFFNRFNTTV